jgi:hypothetical protein
MTRLTGLCLLLLFVAARAAADPAELEKLRDELRQAREEIRVLREENARLRGAAPAPAASVGQPPPAAAPAGSPVAIVTLAPLADGEVVPLDRLLADYRQSALAADARYKGRRFAVRGTVNGFEKPFVGLRWGVILRGADAFGRVQAKVSFPGLSDLRQAADDTELWGRRPFKPENLLARVGDEIILEGDCDGLDDGVIRFNDARPAAR